MKKTINRRKNNAYKYFIYSIFEYFSDGYSKLDNRKFDSIKYLLDDYIDLYQRLKKDENNKLERTYVVILDNILYYFEKTFLKKSDVFSNDIQALIDILKNQDERKRAGTFYNIFSLRKKMDNIGLIEIYIDVLIKQISDYSDVDILIDCIVSEMLYMGYSIEYLKEWWINHFDKKDLQKEDITDEILKFKILDTNKLIVFPVLINMQLPCKLDQEIREKGNLIIGGITYNFSNERSKFPNIKKNEVVLHTNINACDKYKAIDLAVYPIERYIQVYRVQDNFINSKTIKNCYVTYDGKGMCVPMHARKNNVRTFSYREREDIFDFIELRDKIRIEKGNTDNLIDIENVINILQRCSEFTKENRLLNLWSSMENLLRFYEGNSIIGKIDDIVPKIITMYLLKQKMNQLWERLLPIIKTNEDLSICSIEDKKKKYDRDKFLELLLDEEKSLRLYNTTCENVLMQKSILEIHNYFRQQGALKKMVELVYNSVKHNLNTIYRIRNNLVHNGGNLSQNMEYHTRRLQMYLSNTLGILIFHMKRNPSLNIVEILYSIDKTYSLFYKQIENLDKVIICNNNKLKELKEDNHEYKEKIKELNNNFTNELIANHIYDIVYPKYLYI